MHGPACWSVETKRRSMLTCCGPILCSRTRTWYERLEVVGFIVVVVVFCSGHLKSGGGGNAQVWWSTAEGIDPVGCWRCCQLASFQERIRVAVARRRVVCAA